VSAQTPTPAGEPAPAAARGRAALGALVAWLRAAWSRPRVRVASVVLLLVALSLAGTGWDFEPVPPGDAAPAARPSSREASRLAAEGERLQAALRRRVPRGPWIVIDQTHNRLRLMRGDETLLEAPCSAGSGMVLKEGAHGRVWVFDTPRGRFEVLSKTENPVWKKPDWAFVEEGEPIPKDPGERLEYGSLGEYALYFGNGYMIHGTLYERLLGRPVSHGCIRLGREPLRVVYRAAPLGTPVYIY
jgi:lipoprotein-anchoring transpeptidase ErfK/SrfK